VFAATEKADGIDIGTWNGLGKMSRKKLLWIAAAIAAVGIGGWLWLGHAATEADDPEHGGGPGDAVVAAVDGEAKNYKKIEKIQKTIIIKL